MRSYSRYCLPLSTTSVEGILEIVDCAVIWLLQSARSTSESLNENTQPASMIPLFTITPSTLSFPYQRREVYERLIRDAITNTHAEPVCCSASLNWNSNGVPVMTS